MGRLMWLITLLVVLVTAVSCVAVSLLWNLDFESDNPLIGAAAAGLFIVTAAGYIAVTAYGVLTLVVIVARFYKNLFTDEGYLTFTLPVKVSSIYNAKVLSGLAWTGISGLVTIVCFFALVAFSASTENWHYISEGFSLAFEELFKVLPTIDTVMFIVEFVLLTVVSAVFQIVFIYLCVTIGSIIAKKAKIVVSILVYFLANMGISGVLSTIFFIASAIVSGLYWDVISAETVSDEAMAAYMYAQFHTQFILSAVVYAGIGVGVYFLNKYLLKKKLNLA